MGKRAAVIASALIALTTTSLAIQSGVKIKMKQTIRAKYGATIAFVQGQKIDFPDFTLVYTGSKVTGAQHSLQSTTENFAVWKDGKVIEHISQGSGFGDLADDMSSRFVIGDKIFELNFGSAFVNFKTVKMNQLKANQLIVFSSSVEDFRKQAQIKDAARNEQQRKAKEESSKTTVTAVELDALHQNALERLEKRYPEYAKCFESSKPVKDVASFGETYQVRVKIKVSKECGDGRLNTYKPKSPEGGIFTEVLIDARNKSIRYSYKDGDSYRYATLRDESEDEKQLLRAIENSQNPFGDIENYQPIDARDIQYTPELDIPEQPSKKKK